MYHVQSLTYCVSHEAKVYDDAVEKDMYASSVSATPAALLTVYSLEAMHHPRCVGWGEIGLDYHYDNSPRELQQQVLVRQLRQAVRLGKPLTIHTREADDDIERILKAEVPKEHKASNLDLTAALYSYSSRYIYIASRTPQNLLSGYSNTSPTFSSALQVRRLAHTLL